MIELSTGAVLDKELLVTDYANGREFGPRLGWLSTFHPCMYCTKLKTCRRATFNPCDKEYLRLWKERFLSGGQLTIENFGGSA